MSTPQGRIRLGEEVDFTGKGLPRHGRTVRSIVRDENGLITHLVEEADPGAWRPPRGSTETGSFLDGPQPQE